PDGPVRPTNLVAQALTAGDEIILLAESRGEPAGLIHVQLYDTPPLSAMVARRRAHVEDLVVHERFRRRGVGRRVLEAASEWARAHRASEIVLTVWRGNHVAARFYRALGYRPLSQVMARAL